MTVIKIMPDTDSRWDAFVDQHEHSTLFHHSSWATVIEQAFGYTPHYFAMVDDQDRITSAIPAALINSPVTGRRLVSLPFADYCDPLVANQDEFNSLMEHIAAYAARDHIKSVVFKTNQGVTLFNDSDARLKDSFKIHRLSLSCGSNGSDCEVETVFKKLHRGQVQRNIKKARTSKLDVIDENGEAQLRTFYDLILQTRKKHGLPPQPYRFFSALWQHLKKSDRISILIAQKDGKPAAAIMLAWYRDVMYYLYGGSDPEFLKYRPNHLLLWQGIEDAFRRGMRYFDFGRSSLDNKGLIEFKRRWGTFENDVHYFEHRDPAKADQKSEGVMGLKSNLPGIVKHVVRKTPPALLKFGSNIIYKHLGS